MARVKEKDYCKSCNWNDPDRGCFVPSGKEIWQCELYRSRHPEEVEQFEEDMKHWNPEDNPLTDLGCCDPTMESEDI